jgi:hypothetical protein
MKIHSYRLSQHWPNSWNEGQVKYSDFGWVESSLNAAHCAQACIPQGPTLPDPFPSGTHLRLPSG